MSDDESKLATLQAIIGVSDADFCASLLAANDGDLDKTVSVFMGIESRDPRSMIPEETPLPPNAVFGYAPTPSLFGSATPFLPPIGSALHRSGAFGGFRRSRDDSGADLVVLTIHAHPNDPFEVSMPLRSTVATAERFIRARLSLGPDEPREFSWPNLDERARRSSKTLLDLGFGRFKELGTSGDIVVTIPTQRREPRHAAGGDTSSEDDDEEEKEEEEDDDARVLNMLSYPLCIRWDGHEFQLSMAGARTLADLKGSLSKLTGVPSSEIVLHGFPVRNTPNNLSRLRELNLQRKRDNVLVMEQSEFAAIARDREESGRRASERKVTDEDDDDDEDEHDEFDEDYFEYYADDGGGEEDDDELYDHNDFGERLSLSDDAIQSRGPNISGSSPLMPSTLRDPTAATVEFTVNFALRYGDSHPNFFAGTFNEALVEASRNSQPLCVYLHSDSNITTNVFCSQTLCSPQFVNFCRDHLILYAWDVTYPALRGRLREMTGRSSHIVASASSAPAILLVTRDRGLPKVAAAITGYHTADELIVQLTAGMEELQEQLEQAAQEAAVREEERKQRLMIQEDQDRAFRESLLLDQQKEAERRMADEKRRAEEERVRAEEEAARQAEEAQRMAEQRAAQEAERVAHEQRLAQEAALAQLADCVPAEPDASLDSALVTQIRFRLPNGSFLMRRFHRSDRISALLGFLAKEGVAMANHSLMANYPKRNLSLLDASQSLADAQFGAQEQLFVQEN